MKSIILKSQSPRRKELLSKMGYDFTVKVYDCDETMDKNICIIGLKMNNF